ncbi:thiol:disulfide interchange protein DsbA/DsbL [Dechloromonas sp. H13]|uniref:thiol:disulfide interchange protein DsbA/DsbL n=1 Tax=Dechloromonas sp. H13 TaxID=2570193 RepID=UPI0012914066|nr:thiol:disulfide interchange protein DsbA/DsbL [Dechloromonas sp. H13]
MQFARRSFVRSIFALGVALTAAVPALAQTPGKEFTAISPAQPTDDPAKIEVIEFFSYGCPHCNDFHPLISAWAAKQPGDVVVKRVPVTFNRAAWTNAAKLYYTLEATGELARLDNDVFKAIHSERTNLFDDKAIAEWVAKKGVDQKKFADTYNSFGVMSKVKRADQMAQAYRISGVPAVYVDGKYAVAGNNFGELLANTDKAIAKARSEKSGKK